MSCSCYWVVFAVIAYMLLYAIGLGVTHKKGRSGNAFLDKCLYCRSQALDKCLIFCSIYYKNYFKKVRLRHTGKNWELFVQHRLRLAPAPGIKHVLQLAVTGSNCLEIRRYAYRTCKAYYSRRAPFLLNIIHFREVVNRA